MIDFSELPDDGIKFEQLIRELLVLEGFDTHWTGAGQDGGRDLIVVETLKGDFSEYKRKWLISCKHNANSGKSLGRDQAGAITDDCRAIGAEGYILVCSTQPTASLVTRLEEIERSQNILTRYWDGIEIEKRLSKPNTFGLIHTFFPKSALNYQWKIYNAFSPAFWAANYKDYFFYMSCRHSNTYPYLSSIETIVSVLEKVQVFKSDCGWDSQCLRLRGVYFDDKHCTHIAYVDYLYPNRTTKDNIILPKELKAILHKIFWELEERDMNEPDWDILYVKDSMGSDSFQLNHKSYYEPYLKQFEKGEERKKFLHNWVYQIEQTEKLFGENDDPLDEIN